MPDAPDYTLLSDVNVVGSVTLNVNVVGTVDVNIASQTVALNVVLVGSTVTLNVNITGQAAALDVRLTASTITLDVNITGSTVTLNVNVTNASLNVNVIGGSLNVNVTNPVLMYGHEPPVLGFGYLKSYVTFGPFNPPGVPNTFPLTIEAWIYYIPASEETHDYISNFAGEFYGWFIRKTIGNFLLIAVSTGTGYAISGKSINTEGWVHVVAVIRGVGDTVTLYVDGVAQPSSILPAYSPGYDYINLGRHPHGIPLAKTFMKHLRIYKRALTASEIVYNRDNPERPVLTDLVLWCPMNEGAGTTIYDRSGYNNHGTLVDTIWASNTGTAPPLVNVNITGSTVTLNVNIASQAAALNVNIIGSVTLNINIQTQTVDLKVFTPSGRWVAFSDLLPKFTERQTGVASAGVETIVKTVTGRGRLRTLSFYVMDTGTPIDISNQIRIRVYVDGVLRVDTSLIGVDSLSGFPLDYMRAALTHHLFWGLGLPFNTAKIDSAPDRYIVVPPHLSPFGGLTMAIWDYPNSRYRMMAGYINLEMEFLSSLSIRIYNANTTYDVFFALSYDIGEYP